jgi:hypothetical protein
MSAVIEALTQKDFSVIKKATHQFKVQTPKMKLIFILFIVLVPRGKGKLDTWLIFLMKKLETLFLRDNPPCYQRVWQVLIVLSRRTTYFFVISLSTLSDYRESIQSWPLGLFISGGKMNTHKYRTGLNVHIHWNYFRPRDETNFGCFPLEMTGVAACTVRFHSEACETSKKAIYFQ